MRSAEEDDESPLVGVFIYSVFRVTPIAMVKILES